MVFYWGVFSHFAFHKSKSHSLEKPPVSVVICARDEAYNLEHFLPHFLEQNYPDYEVIVVNDKSTDDTAHILLFYAKKYPHLKVINLESSVTNIKGKKFPLSIGIKSAKNDIVLLSDADCKPCSEYWIENMVKNYRPGVDIVVGYGSYIYEKSILNSIIRYDTMHTAIQYFSYSLCGRTYMGVGRNLSYKKSFFFKHKGFQSMYCLLSGDDDIFVNKFSTSKNTAVAYNFEARTESVPKHSFVLYRHQKTRHLESSKHYKFKDKLTLGMYGISLPLFYFSLIALIVLFVKMPLISYIAIVGGALLLKTISQHIIFGLSAKKLQEPKMRCCILLHDMVYAFLSTYFLISSRLKRTHQWR